MCKVHQAAVCDDSIVSGGTKNATTEIELISFWTYEYSC